MNRRTSPPPQASRHAKKNKAIIIIINKFVFSSPAPGFSLVQQTTMGHRGCRNYDTLRRDPREGVSQTGAHRSANSPPCHHAVGVLRTQKLGPLC